MGWIDRHSIHACIERFRDGEDGRLAQFLTEQLPRTGNAPTESATGWSPCRAGSKAIRIDRSIFRARRPWVGAGFARGGLAPAA